MTPAHCSILIEGDYKNMLANIIMEKMERFGWCVELSDFMGPETKRIIGHWEDRSVKSSEKNKRKRKHV